MNLLKTTKLFARKLQGLSSFHSNPIHFLHVGKAAGTQIHSIIQQVNRSRWDGKIIKHGHKTELIDLPSSHAYFFSTRDPIERFKSGFYSRLRKGQPRLYVEWSEHERLAFEQFPHANDLAESLFLPCELGHDAVAAMRSIRHCSRNLVDWFRFCGHLFEVYPPIWIIRQENFGADIDVFLRRIGYEGSVDFATEKSVSHANDYEGVPSLSDAAKMNLRRWYAQDYEFLALCTAWMSKADDYIPVTKTG